MAAEGVANDRIATDLRVSATSVRSWRRRFSGEGLARFAQVRAGRGPKPSISAETVEAIVQATLRSNEGSDALELPDDGQAVRVSAATVQRIWHARGLKPHMMDRFGCPMTRRSRRS